MSMTSLADPVLAQIFDYLEFRDRLSCCAVCKRWNNFLSHIKYWTKCYVKVEFPVTNRDLTKVVQGLIDRGMFRLLLNMSGNPRKELLKILFGYFPRFVEIRWRITGGNAHGIDFRIREVMKETKIWCSWLTTLKIETDVHNIIEYLIKYFMEASRGLSEISIHCMMTPPMNERIYGAIRDMRDNLKSLQLRVTPVTLEERFHYVTCEYTCYTMLPNLESMTLFGETFAMNVFYVILSKMEYLTTLNLFYKAGETGMLLADKLMGQHTALPNVENLCIHLDGDDVGAVLAESYQFDGSLDRGFPKLKYLDVGLINGAGPSARERSCHHLINRIPNLQWLNLMNNDYVSWTSDNLSTQPAILNAPHLHTLVLRCSHNMKLTQQIWDAAVEIVKSKPSLTVVLVCWLETRVGSKGRPFLAPIRYSKSGDYKYPDEVVREYTEFGECTTVDSDRNSQIKLSLHRMYSDIMYRHGSCFDLEPFLKYKHPGTSDYVHLTKISEADSQ